MKAMRWPLVARPLASPAHDITWPYSPPISHANAMRAMSAFQQRGNARRGASRLAPAHRRGRGRPLERIVGRGLRKPALQVRVRHLRRDHHAAAHRGHAAADEELLVM